MRIAHPRVMAATRYEELEAWQISDALKKKVYALIAASPASRDRHFCDQLRDSASSAPANLAEGFGYYDHPEFARHVRIAKASLHKTHNHLQDGVDREFWNEATVAPLLKLANDAAGKCVKLAKYLSNTDAPGSWRKPKQQKRR
jgi:four helix bundle protein